MIICGTELNCINSIFPELEYKWTFNIGSRIIPELIMNEPFKASREYEYPDEEKEEIIEKKRKELEEKEKALRELEERKHTRILQILRFGTCKIYTI